MNEEWQDIQKFPKHQVSNLGNIRIKNGRILKNRCPNRTGYIRVVLGGGKKRPLLHRLVADAFIPNLENKSQVNHIDGNKQNNAANNLEWVTPSENQKHAYYVLGVKTGFAYGCGIMRQNQKGEKRPKTSASLIEYHQLKKESINVQH